MIRLSHPPTRQDWFPVRTHLGCSPLAQLRYTTTLLLLEHHHPSSTASDHSAHCARNIRTYFPSPIPSTDSFYSIQIRIIICIIFALYNLQSTPPFSVFFISGFSLTFSYRHHRAFVDHCLALGQFLRIPPIPRVRLPPRLVLAVSTHHARLS
jgi:hypothetical protein